jgi:hypothetical protein
MKKDLLLASTVLVLVLDGSSGSLAGSYKRSLFRLYILFNYFHPQGYHGRRGIKKESCMEQVLHGNPFLQETPRRDIRSNPDRFFCLFHFLLASPVILPFCIDKMILFIVLLANIHILWVPNHIIYIYSS